MNIPLQVTFHNIRNSDTVEQYIRENTQKLEEFFSDIISCHVVVKMPHKHHNQGNQFSVHINITVPGDDIVINRDHHEDVYIAIQNAFNAAKRQLKDYAHHLRRETKTHAPELTGYISKIFQEEGCGFIMGDDGTERYFHRDNVKNPNFEHIKTGDLVRFIEENHAERPQAKRVSVAQQ